MGNNLSVDAELTKILEGYSREVSQDTIKCADETARLTKKYIQAIAPRKRGKYRKGFRVKKMGKGNFLIHNPKYGQLTHLLERGHATRKTGVRTRAFPHFAPAEQFAKETFIQKIERTLSK